MLDGLFMLLTLSTLMAIASFLAGSLPLSFSLSQSQLRLVSTIGMGVLVGTSLIVIIPEGVETLYSANEAGHRHASRDMPNRPLDIRWSAPITPVRLARSEQAESHIFARNAYKPDAYRALPDSAISPSFSAFAREAADPPKTPTGPNEVHALGSENPSSSTPEGTTKQHGTTHAWIGISLVLGFILMYLIDMLPSLTPAPTSQRTLNVYSLSDLSSSSPSTPAPTALPRGTFSTTLGLVIHAAADGIALGASSTQPSLSFIIFLAIMVHKAPAAFGLTSVLLKQGLGKRAARVHLLIFSLAAPIGALGTWMVVQLLGGGGKGAGGEETTQWWTGILLLFSGGTFLYVAMHTMQEDSDNHALGYEESHGNGYLDGSHGRDPGRQKPGRSLRLVLAAVAGMLLPLITQIGHAH